MHWKLKKKRHPKTCLKIIQINPFEEYLRALTISYKHRYYIAYMDILLPLLNGSNKVDWKTTQVLLYSSYNIEKQIITKCKQANSNKLDQQYLYV